MTKLAAVSPADLLRFHFEPQGLGDYNASLLGYVCNRRELASSEFPTTPLPLHTAVEQLEKEFEFSNERPPLKFLMPVQAATLRVRLPATSTSTPIDDSELGVRKNNKGLPLRPLVQWSRLASFLKSRLGSQMAGTRLDERMLIRQTTNGLQIRRIPRRTRQVWASQVVLLWDCSREMFPFLQDADWLRRRLKRECGNSGLKVIKCKGTPRADQLASIPSGVPILAVSAMGQFDRNESVQTAWSNLSHCLKTKQHRFQVLTPCPRDRWNSQLAIDWSAVLWDRGNRLPRSGSMRALPRSENYNSSAEEILDPLAPASLVESTLLREVRLLQDPPTNAGTEWDAWHHPNCRHSLDAFDFLPCEDYDNRLARRAERAARDPRLAEITAKVADAIRKQHETYSILIAAEAELRNYFSGSPNEQEFNEVQALLPRVVERLRRLALHPGEPEGIECGLPTWFPTMVDQLTPEMRQAPMVAETIVEGLALAHSWLKTRQTTRGINLPLGVCPNQFAAKMREAELRIGTAGPPEDHLVGITESRLSIFPTGTEPKTLKQLGRVLLERSGQIQVGLSCSPPVHYSLPIDGTFPSGIEINIASPPAEIQFHSSHGRLDFKTMERPAWANRIWYDRFGIAVEFRVRDVPFVLRWIPPGRFLMGSPYSEAGRNTNEGPQHEVTITRGFWLGQTPITQKQWAAVVTQEQVAALEIALKPAPSEFNDSANLPVETVSWDMAKAFCRLLEKLVAIEGGFCLPTEAEWEYACRAGTESAFHDGSPCTLPGGKDPALTELGWFEDISKRKTHPVKKKRPNNWGLFDMHGNVAEWCDDDWDKDIYRSRAEGTVDPLTRTEEGASRVVRGGSWRNSPASCRAAFRSASPLVKAWVSIGFRLFAGQDSFLEAERPVSKRRSRG